MRFYDKYDKLVKDSFALIKDFVVDEWTDMQEYEELGIAQPKRRVSLSKFYFLMDYLVFFSKKAQKIIDKKGYLTQEDYDKLYLEFDIECLIKTNVCDKFTKQIIKIFKPEILNTTKPITYVWDSVRICVLIDNVYYYLPIILNKVQDNKIIESYQVPINSELDWYNFIPDAEAIFDARYIYVNHPNCCANIPINPIVVSVVTLFGTTTITWTGGLAPFRVLIENETDVVYDFTTNGNEIIVEDLPAANYAVKVTSITCAGRTTDSEDIIIPEANCNFEITEEDGNLIAKDPSCDEQMIDGTLQDPECANIIQDDVVQDESCESIYDGTLQDPDCLIGDFIEDILQDPNCISIVNDDTLQDIACKSIEDNNVIQDNDCSNLTTYEEGNLIINNPTCGSLIERVRTVLVLSDDDCAEGEFTFNSETEEIILS